MSPTSAANSRGTSSGTQPGRCCFLHKDLNDEQELLQPGACASGRWKLSSSSCSSVNIELSPLTSSEMHWSLSFQHSSDVDRRNMETHMINGLWFWGVRYLF